MLVCTSTSHLDLGNSLLMMRANAPAAAATEAATRKLKVSWRVVLLREVTVPSTAVSNSSMWDDT